MPYKSDFSASSLHPEDPSTLLTGKLYRDEHQCIDAWQSTPFFLCGNMYILIDQEPTVPMAACGRQCQFSHIKIYGLMMLKIWDTILLSVKSQSAIIRNRRSSNSKKGCTTIFIFSFLFLVVSIFLEMTSQFMPFLLSGTTTLYLVQLLPFVQCSFPVLTAFFFALSLTIIKWSWGLDQGDILQKQ